MNLFNPKQVSFVGIITYKETNTGQTKEVRTDNFWGSAYKPNELQIRLYLKGKGYTHVGDVDYSRVM